MGNERVTEMDISAARSILEGGVSDVERFFLVVLRQSIGGECRNHGRQSIWDAISARINDLLSRGEFNLQSGATYSDVVNLFIDIAGQDVDEEALVENVALFSHLVGLAAEFIDQLPEGVRVKFSGVPDAGYVETVRVIAEVRRRQAFAS